MTEGEIGHKIVLLGDTGVGKSSIINRFISDTFLENCGSTLAGCFSKKSVKFPEFNESVLLNIWDTAGQEKYRSLNKMFYQDAECIILVYDITRQNTFKELKNFWVNEIQKYVSTDERILYLVGNKLDEAEYRDLSKDIAQNWAEDIKAVYIETSAKTPEGIDDLFYGVARFFVGTDFKSTKNNKRSFLSSHSKDNVKVSKEKGGCC